MEPARNLLARPLPHMLHDGGTENPSVHGSPVSAAFFAPWTSFYEDVRVALQSMDLSGQVSLIESRKGERYLAGNDLGLTARFVRNLCDPVSEALSVTHLHQFMFGDINSVRPATTDIPDLVILKVDDPEHPDSRTPTLEIVGELKTSWTFELEAFPVTVTSSIEDLGELERPVGQTIRYMIRYKLKYGFLGTYKSTVFMRRVADYKFEMSPPVDYQATQPSLRECFVAFTAFAANDGAYNQAPDFNIRLLSTSGLPGVQNSTRDSYFRNHRISQSAPDAISDFSNRSVIIGQDGGARAYVTCVNVLSMTPGKTVMMVDFAGQKAVAKHWSGELQDTYEYEKAFYCAITDRYPDGSAFFPSLLAYGEVVCSSPSLVAGGSLMVLSWEDGKRLSDLWPTLDQSNLIYIRNKCREAVAVIRQLNIYRQDSNRTNVLFDRRTGKVTMVDFEHYGMCTERHLRNLDAPELLALFGRSGVLQISGG